MLSNKIKRPISFLCVILLLLAFQSIVFAFPSDGEDVFYVDGIRVDSNYLQNQFAANEAYNRLLLSYEYGDSYPGYYAGAYIDTTTGHLTICTKNASEANIQLLKSILLNDDVSFLEVDYSMAELQDLKNTLIAVMEDEVEPNLVSIGINDAMNKVSVSVLDENRFQKDISRLKGVQNNSTQNMIDMRLGSINHEFASVQPGDGIQAATNSGSVGYVCRVRINGQLTQGFVTAAHVISPSTNNVLKGLSTIGYANPTIGGNPVDGNYDVTFVTLKNDVTYTNNLGTVLSSYPPATLRNSVSSVPAVNSVVFKKGAASGITSGSVTSTGTTMKFRIGNTTTYYEQHDLLEMTASGQPGDSGGCVFTYVNTSQAAEGLATAVGVFKGGSSGTGYGVTKHGNFPFTCVVS